MSGAYTNYLVNKMLDHVFRGMTYTKPTQIWAALIHPNKNYWTVNTAYGTSDYIVPSTPNGRLYRCTVAGTSAAVTEPTWPTTDGGTVADGVGALVWTEQSIILKAGIVSEMSGNNYARVQLDPSYSNWKGTNGEVTDTPSAGITGLVKNNATITFPVPSGAWNLVTHVYLFDAVAGNGLHFGPLTTCQYVNAGAAAPIFAVDALIASLN